MSVQPFTTEQRQFLLNLARQALTSAVRGEKIPVVDLKQISPELAQEGASFVTLTKRGELRGCIGALEAYQPLVNDVIEHAIAAGLDDYRFGPVQPEELAEIHIEISRLTPPSRLPYEDSKDLVNKLRPGIDGVILRDGRQRATFLPQVWEQLSDPAEFLSHLCYKMGAQPDAWRKKKLDVSVYQVEEFHE